MQSRVNQLQEALRKLSTSDELREEATAVKSGRTDDIAAVRAIMRLKEENKGLMQYVDRLIQALLERDIETVEARA